MKGRSLYVRHALVVCSLMLALTGSFSPIHHTQAQVVTAQPLPDSPYSAEAFKIADQLQCPVCQGVTVAYSNSGLAQQMRALIVKKLEQSQSRDQILQYFVDRYGESILTDPPKSGFTALVWVLPVLGVLLGTGVIAAVLRTWYARMWPSPSRERPVRVASNGLTEPAPLSAGVEAAYTARVERELAQFRANENGTRGSI